MVSISAPEGTSLETLYNSIMRFFLLSLALFAVFGLTACKGGGQKQSSAILNNNANPASAPAATESPSRSLPKIVAFGDSLTAGYGLPLEAIYPSLLQEKLYDDGYQYEVVNSGVSGDTSAGGLRRIDWSLEGDVKIVILELGANDILRGQPIQAMEENLGRIIERAKARGAQVLLAGMEAPTNSGLQYRKDAHEAFQ